MWNHFDQQIQDPLETWLVHFCDEGVREVILLDDWQHVGQLTLETRIPAFADNSVETKLCFAIRLPTLNICFSDCIMALPGRLPQGQWN